MHAQKIVKIEYSTKQSLKRKHNNKKLYKLSKNQRANIQEKNIS